MALLNTLAVPPLLYLVGCLMGDTLPEIGSNKLAVNFTSLCMGRVAAERPRAVYGTPK